MPLNIDKSVILFDIKFKIFKFCKVLLHKNPISLLKLFKLNFVIPVKEEFFKSSL